MKANREWERSDIVVDPELIVTENNEIEAYVECWFDVDAKFGTDTKNDDDTWINMYANYNPFKNTLDIEYVVDRPSGTESFEYRPTKGESDLIKNLIAEKTSFLYGMTPREFVRTVG